MQQRSKRVYPQTPDAHAKAPTNGTRVVHAAGNPGEILNGDPGKSYVLANGGEEQEFNFEYYESIGYQIETKQKGEGTVRVLLGQKAKVGDPLKWRGMVLMSCSKERKDEIFNEGPTGSTGQNYQDKIYEKIKLGRLEKKINVPGMHQSESWDQWQTKDPEVFR